MFAWPGTWWRWHASKLHRWGEAPSSTSGEIIEAASTEGANLKVFSFFQSKDHIGTLYWNIVFSRSCHFDWQLPSLPSLVLGSGFPSGGIWHWSGRENRWVPNNVGTFATGLKPWSGSTHEDHMRSEDWAVLWVRLRLSADCSKLGLTKDESFRTHVLCLVVGLRRLAFTGPIEGAGWASTATAGTEQRGASLCR